MSIEPICGVWRRGMSSSERRRYLLVGDEDVFLWEKKMSCCWRRLYGHGRCLLVGEDSMVMEDVEKNICSLDMIEDDMI